MAARRHAGQGRFLTLTAAAAIAAACDQAESEQAERHDAPFAHARHRLGLGRLDGELGLGSWIWVGRSHDDRFERCRHGTRAADGTGREGCAFEGDVLKG